MKTILFFKSLDLLISLVICAGSLPYLDHGGFILLFLFLGIYHMISVILNGFYILNNRGSYNGQRGLYFLCVLAYFFIALITGSLTRAFPDKDFLFALLVIPPAILGLWYICICALEVRELWQIIYKGKSTETAAEDKSETQNPDNLFI